MNPLLTRRRVELQAQRIDRPGTLASIPVQNAVAVSVTATLINTTSASWTNALELRTVVGSGPGATFASLTSAAGTAVLLESDLAGISELRIEVPTANGANTYINLDVTIDEKAA